ncbi:helix-turn-helix domain-containing protein [Nocardia farcinica]|uniref:helix-turn-helix domain-containing protein n=1 Tax=Nocardia farcinica TaxID=37329 RepID=UPI0024582F80|nr:helix-turn-helix domain-containing protein [Nocardia farcinica]
MADGRVDVWALHKALDARRRATGLSWRQVAEQAGVSASLLSRMSNGQRPDLDGFASLVQWLDTPAETFMVRPGQEATTAEEPELEQQLAPLLRARKDLSDADREYLLEVVQATMRRVKRSGS